MKKNNLPYFSNQEKSNFDTDVQKKQLFKKMGIRKNTSINFFNLLQSIESEAKK